MIYSDSVMEMANGFITEGVYGQDYKLLLSADAKRASTLWQEARQLKKSGDKVNAIKKYKEVKTILNKLKIEANKIGDNDFVDSIIISLTSSILHAADKHYTRNKAIELLDMQIKAVDKEMSDI